MMKSSRLRHWSKLVGQLEEAYLHEAAEDQKSEQREQGGAHESEVPLRLESVESETSHHGSGQEEGLNDDGDVVEGGDESD